MWPFLNSKKNLSWKDEYGTIVCNLDLHILPGAFSLSSGLRDQRMSPSPKDKPPQETWPLLPSESLSVRTYIASDACSVTSLLCNKISKSNHFPFKRARYLFIVETGVKVLSGCLLFPTVVESWFLMRIRDSHSLWPLPTQRKSITLKLRSDVWNNPLSFYILGSGCWIGTLQTKLSRFFNRSFGIPSICLGLLSPIFFFFSKGFLLFMAKEY